MRHARCYAACGIIDGKIIVAGGRGNNYKPLSTVEMFDPESNTWQDLPSMPNPMEGAASAILGKCMYLLGGFNPMLTNEIMEFNMLTWKWKRLPARMKGYRHGVAAVGVSSENSVVVTGGHGGMSIETICEAWNPDSKRWSKIASLPTRRFAHACVGMQLNELSIVRAVEAAKKARERMLVEIPLHMKKREKKNFMKKSLPV